RRLNDADGGKRKEGAAQPQDAKAEDQRQAADAHTGDRETRHQRPFVRIHQPDTDVAAQSEEHDAAEIDIARIAEHQIEIAGERDVERVEQQTFAQRHVVAVDGRQRERQHRERDDPEKRAAHHRRHQSAPRRERKMPAGNAINTRTNSTNSITSVQLTGTNGVTAPSSSPSAMPPISAPIGLPKPPSTVTTKPLS